MNRTATDKMLREARIRVIRRAAKAERSKNQLEKVSWELRRAILDEELNRFQMSQEGQLLPKRVFVSYSQTSGTKYFGQLQRLLKVANFEVIDGFREVRGTDGNILRNVLHQLRRSTFYMAILSKEIPVRHGRGVRWAPGVWLSEEKGMALALERPFVLLIHEEIYEDFWKKTTPEKAHIFFNDKNFGKQAKDAVERANNRYDEYIIKSLKAYEG
jgi:hypothetical protein